MSDTAFLRTILDDPKIDAPRLIYADWLEEHGRPEAAAKAEFLRLTVELATIAKKKNRKRRRLRLQQLAAELDTAWLAVVSRLPIENCQGERRAARRGRPRGESLRFDFECGLRWEDLQPTDDGATRHCDRCQHNVYYCDTIMAAREHAGAGHCIAVDLGVIRRPNDLAPPRMVMGLVSADYFAEQEALQKPDAVSEERERCRQAATTNTQDPLP